MTIPITILCGGLATRLYPTTKTIPKSLVMIGDTPFISYQLDLLYRKGITDVVLCVGKFGNMIEDYVGDGSFWGLRVKYSYEDEDYPLGTGGAIKNALDLLPDKFMITYGDSFLDINYNRIVSKFHKNKKPMLITIYKNNNIGDKSNILYKNRKILNYDKNNPTSDMKHIDCGLIVVKKSVFDDYPNNKFDLSSVVSDLVIEGCVSSYVSQTQFYEIGSKEGIKEFETTQSFKYY